MVHIHKLRDSFKYAWRGVRIVFRDEQNFRIQLALAILVLLVAILIDLPSWKIIVLLLVSAFVLILELVNSIFERLLDAFRPRVHQYIEEMKDIMAAAVLMASIGAVVIGLIIFWPDLANSFSWVLG
ncbi:diacylglycerol kinase [Candidatus Uhrbacteria bacterium]|nr:diacylglycerol kinase [Candidatus Uhrbacteria bacterium]